MKRPCILVCFVIFLLLSGCYAENPERIALRDYALAEADRVELCNCHNGKTTTILEPGDIAAIAAFVEEAVGIRPESGKGYYEGSYSLAFYKGEEKFFSLAFGDTDCFYTGKGKDGYPIRYLLENKTISGDVIPFLSQFDRSGADYPNK